MSRKRYDNRASALKTLCETIVTYGCGCAFRSGEAEEGYKLALTDQYDRPKYTYIGEKAV